MSVSGSGDEDLEQAQTRVGRTLRGKWKLDSLIGIGGMAAVYAATHKLGRRDAIKILHPQVAVSKELRARFEQEAHAVIKLGHPGTVQVLDVDVTEEGAPFMVMEFLDGESLGQRAYRLGGLEEHELFGYADKLLEVLVAAHAHGIIHRDIKPDNLFITSGGQLKVLDFGIARMRESSNVHTRTGAMLGTTPYMAPEQIHAKPIDGRADLYALGATLYRILAKKKIHEADSDAELLMKMGSTPASPLRVAAPRQRVNAHVLNHAIDGNGHAGDHNRVLQTPNLIRRTQCGGGEHANHDVRVVRVCPLHALVGAEPGDKGREAEQGADGVDHDQRHNGEKKGIAPCAAPTFARGRWFARGSGAPCRQPAVPAIGNLDDPCQRHNERNGAHQADLVRLKDAAGIDVEEEGRNDQRRQPARFQNTVTPLIEF